MQSHNYVLGVSGWKMHSNGTLEVNGKIRAVVHDPVEKPDKPFAVDGDQVILSQASIDSSMFSGLSCMCKGGYTGTPADKAEKAEVKIGCTVDVSKALDQISKVLSTTELAQSLESVTAKIEHEVTTRTTADTQLAARIGALEARINAAESRITQQGSAITPLK